MNTTIQKEIDPVTGAATTRFVYEVDEVEANQTQWRAPAPFPELTYWLHSENELAAAQALAAIHAIESNHYQIIPLANSACDELVWIVNLIREISEGKMYPYFVFSPLFPENPSVLHTLFPPFNDAPLPVPYPSWVVVRWLIHDWDKTE